MEEVSKICSDILGEIVETAFKDAAETVDEVCDSILDILNLDSPGIYSDPKNPSALLVFGQRLPSLLRDISRAGCARFVKLLASGILPPSPWPRC